MSDRRVLTVAVAVALLAVLPAAAQAERFRGKTQQGERVTLVTGPDGKLKRFTIQWRARACTDPQATFDGFTGLRRPLDRSSRRKFFDFGSYRVREREGGSSRVTSRTGGRRVSPRRWRGRYSARTVTRRGGRVVDRCRLAPVRWTVTRR